MPGGLAAAALDVRVECGRPFTLPIRGTSMFPFLKAGDSVRIVPARPGDLRLGDCMAFWREGQVVVHRFAGWGRSGGVRMLRQKGDNVRGFSLVPPGELIGRVEAVISPRGDRSMDGPGGRFRNRLQGLRAWSYCAAVTAARALRHGGGAP